MFLGVLTMKKIMSYMFCFTVSVLQCSVDSLSPKDELNTKTAPVKSEKLYYPPSILDDDEDELATLHKEILDSSSAIREHHIRIQENLDTIEKKLFCIMYKINDYERQEDELKRRFINDLCLAKEDIAAAADKLKKFITDNKPYIDVLKKKRLALHRILTKDKDWVLMMYLRPIVFDLLESNCDNKINMAFNN